MRLSESDLYSKFRNNVIKKGNDECDYKAAINVCLSKLIESKNDDTYLYKEYILLKLDTTSMPFGLNKGDDVISKILKYGNLFFEKLLTCVGTIMVSSEVIKHSNTDSMMRSLLIYAGLWVGISALFAVIKWSLNSWKKDWSRIVFVIAFQEPFAAIIGKMISNKQIKEMNDTDFTNWALKILFNEKIKKADF